MPRGTLGARLVSRHYPPRDQSNLPPISLTRAWVPSKTAGVLWVPSVGACCFWEITDYCSAIASARSTSRLRAPLLLMPRKAFASAMPSAVARKSRV